MNERHWAKSYYENVRMARKALDIDAERSYRLNRGSSVCVNDVGLDWAHDVIRNYEAFYRVCREGFRGAIGEGIEMADLHYREGLTQGEIGKMLHYHRCTVSQRLRRLFDHLDSFSREEILHSQQIDDERFGQGKL